MLAVAGSKTAASEEEVVILKLADGLVLPVSLSLRAEFSHIKDLSLAGLGLTEDKFLRTVLPSIKRQSNLQSLDVSNNLLNSTSFHALARACIYNSGVQSALSPLQPGSSKHHVCPLGLHMTYPIMEKNVFISWQYKNMVFDRDADFHEEGFQKLQVLNISQNPIFGDIRSNLPVHSEKPGYISSVEKVQGPWNAFQERPEVNSDIFPSSINNTNNNNNNNEEQYISQAQCTLLLLLFCRKRDLSEELQSSQRTHLELESFVHACLDHHEMTHITEEEHTIVEEEDEDDGIDEDEMDCQKPYICIPRNLLDHLYNLLPSSYLHTLVFVDIGLHGKYSKFLLSFLTSWTQTMSIHTLCNSLKGFILTHTMLALYEDSYDSCTKYPENEEITRIEQEFYKVKKFTGKYTDIHDTMVYAYLEKKKTLPTIDNNMDIENTNTNTNVKTKLVYELVDDDTAMLDAMMDADLQKQTSISPKSIPRISTQQQNPSATTATSNVNNLNGIPDKMKFLYGGLDEEMPQMLQKLDQAPAFGLKGRSRVVMSNSTSIVLPKNALEQEVELLSLKDNVTTTINAHTNNSTNNNINNIKTIHPRQPTPPIAQPPQTILTSTTSRPTSSNRPIQPIEKHAEQPTFKRASGSKKQKTTETNNTKPKAIVIPSSKIKKTETK